MAAKGATKVAQIVSDERSPNPIDIHVGQRIRARRREIGVSQEELSDRVRLTFQQIQKYEKGSNRVSASKLYQIAAALKVPVAYFFKGLPEADKADDPLDSQSNLMTRVIALGGLPLLESFASMGGEQQRVVINVARDLAKLGQPAA